MEESHIYFRKFVSYNVICLKDEVHYPLVRRQAVPGKTEWMFL